MNATIKLQIHDILTTYESYLSSLSGALLTSLITNESMSATGEQRLRVRLNDFYYHYSEQIENKIDAGIDQVVSESLRTAFSSYSVNPLSQLQIDTLDSFSQTVYERSKLNILAQMEANLKQVINEFKLFQIKVVMAQSRGLSRNDAILATRANLEQTGFVRTDAMGRKWASVRYISTELNMIFYDTSNIIMVYLLTIRGDDTAIVQREGRGVDRVSFLLSEFEALKGKYFHPNSKALVLPIDMNTH